QGRTSTRNSCLLISPRLIAGIFFRSANPKMKISKSRSRGRAISVAASEPLTDSLIHCDGITAHSRVDDARPPRGPLIVFPVQQIFIGRQVDEVETGAFGSQTKIGIPLAAA